MTVVGLQKTQKRCNNCMHWQTRPGNLQEDYEICKVILNLFIHNFQIKCNGQTFMEVVLTYMNK
jgi:hypothetical protein